MKQICLLFILLLLSHDCFASGISGQNASGISVVPTTTLGVITTPIQGSKLSGSPSVAPGAGVCQFFYVAGTNVGSCKLQVQCGTSSTPVLIVDNVGSGC